MTMVLYRVQTIVSSWRTHGLSQNYRTEGRRPLLSLMFYIKHDIRV